VKTMNRTNQKKPRRSAMQQGSRFKPCDQWHCYGHALLLARPDATSVDFARSTATYGKRGR
jgi:hypothetical protein